MGVAATAAATVAARDGQLRTTVRMMNTNSDTAGPFYVADTGSVILKLKWISSNRVLAVFDTYAAIINVSDGTESARYDYGGATLQSVSIGGRSTALLLAVRKGMKAAGNLLLDAHWLGFAEMFGLMLFAIVLYPALFQWVEGRKSKS